MKKKEGISFNEAIEILKAAEAGKEIEALDTTMASGQWQRITPSLGVICYHINAGRKLRVNEPPRELWVAIGDKGIILGGRETKHAAEQTYPGAIVIQFREVK